MTNLGVSFAVDPLWQLDTSAERHDALKLHPNYRDKSRRRAVSDAVEQSISKAEGLFHASRKAL